MSNNSFGRIFRLSSFGESHGVSLGGIIDGCPSGLKIDFNHIQYELNRRRPSQSLIVSERKEKDEVRFLSGIFEGITTGAPIAFMVDNQDERSYDYEHLKNLYRPSHSDFTYDKKYGVRDYKGSGRASARETLSWVVAGAIAKQIVKELKITAYVYSLENLLLDTPYQELDFSQIEKSPIRCPDKKISEKMIALIKKAKQEGDSLGGMIKCVIKNVPIGLGEPVFDKLQARLAQAMLSINAVKGFEYGSGFEGTRLKGSSHNDIFIKGGKTLTNHSGGIQGGISNGMDIYFNVAFKPTSTIIRPQKSIDKEGKEQVVEGKGRHDPCVLPRAVPIIEAMSALVLVDFWLLNRNTRLKTK